MVDGVHDVDVAARSNGNSIDKNAVAHAGTDSVACLPLESSWLKRKSRSFERCFDIQSEPKKRRNKSSNKKETESEFETVWICVECKEAECMMEPEATDLLICDGLCRRLFHYPCAGLEKLPQEDEEFICTDCKNRKHICSICSNYGNDNEDVFNCSKNTCGLFFHESCLAIQNVDVEVVPEDDAKTDVEKSVGNFDFAGTVVMRRRFVCPAHSCWTCTQTDLREQEKTTNAGVPVAAKPRSKGKSRKKIVKQPGVFESKCERFMTRCLECPIAYHFSCIPPSARFHELATLCHEHAGTCKLPELDPELSIQERIERAIDKKFDNFVGRSKRQVKAARSHGKNVFFPGITGDIATTRDVALLKAFQEEKTADMRRPTLGRLLFCLPCDFKDDVHSKPPNYRHVHALQYNPLNKPPRIPLPGDVCQCFDRCGEDCINRMLYTECVGDVAKTKNGGAKDSNCRVGLNCSNRQLGQRKAAKCKPQREKGKGWGLCLINKAKKGDLIQEYVGDIIDATTKEKRLTEWSQEHPNDSNFYVMALQPGWFIDARDVANLSRFVNHSCEPNCSLLQINVNGRMRCGIFAMREIEPGEFLSYDYHFDTKHGDRFVCCCGSLNCRGTMKGGSAQHNLVAKKSKADLWEEAKTGYERDKKFLAEFHGDRVARSTQVDVVVPGADSGTMDELVANGAQVKHRDNARHNRIFLWRNATQGGDFSERFDKFRLEDKVPNL